MDYVRLREAFYKVKTHLLAQKKRATSRDLDKCCYRGDNGLKCAIGCLIPDEEYAPQFEYSYGLGDIAARVSTLAGLDLIFLRELQDVHDKYEPDEWSDRLAKLESKWIM